MLMIAYVIHWLRASRTEIAVRAWKTEYTIEFHSFMIVVLPPEIEKWKVTEPISNWLDDWNACILYWGDSRTLTAKGALAQQTPNTIIGHWCTVNGCRFSLFSLSLYYSFAARFLFSTLVHCEFIQYICPLTLNLIHRQQQQLKMHLSHGRNNQESCWSNTIDLDHFHPIAFRTVDAAVLSTNQTPNRFWHRK